MTEIKKERKRAPGGGRKKGEPTKLKRIPVEIEDAIDGLIELYKYNEKKWPFIKSGQKDKAEEMSEVLGVPANVLLVFQITNRDIEVNGRRLKQKFEDSNSSYYTDTVFNSVIKNK